MNMVVVFFIVALCYSVAQLTFACVDLTNSASGVSDCPSLAYLCNNTVYYTLMTQQCPYTCGRCTSTTLSTCYDVATNCASLAYLCINTIYYTVMTQQCAATCGRCSTTSTTTSTSTCVDLVNSATGLSNCAAASYLCNNTIYYTLMTQQCPKTCGRCSSG